MKESKISIVTVCWNAESCIEKTIQSIIDQTFCDYEYLIIDGASTDSTMRIVEKYRESFRTKDIKYFYISEPDHGIYDAMNKSIGIAEGEWILFMNAGDTFFDNAVLEKIFSANYTNADVVYGNVLLTENGKFKKAAIGEITDNSVHSPICHQGTMIKTQLMKKFRFNTEYRLAADYDVLLRLYNNGAVFFKTEIVMAIFELGGTSSKQSVKYLKEMNQSRLMNNYKFKELFCVSKIRLYAYNYLRTLYKKLLCGLFYSEKRGWFTDKYRAVGM